MATGKGEVIATEKWPGVYRITSPFDRDFNAWIKDGDGGKDGGRRRYHFDFAGAYGYKAWYLPKERLVGLEDYCMGKGWALKIRPITSLAPQQLLDLPSDLTPWQEAGVLMALSQRVLLAQWITGSGKSRLAVETYKAIAKRQPGSKALIVCPKVVMRTWEEQQLPRWLGQSDEDSAETPWWSMLTGRKLEVRGKLRPQPNILLVSWDSLHRIPDKWVFDLIVFDELHAGIHGQSKRSQQAAKLSARNGDAIRLGLTATPTSASLTDIWSEMNILCPHRWGNYNAWWRRYFVETPVGFEDYTEPGALKSDRLPELIEQMETVCHCVTHDDVGDALPPVDWQELRIGKGTTSFRTPPANIKQWRAEQMLTGKDRAKAFVETAGKEIANSTQPVGIVVYHRQLAEEIVKRLEPNLGTKKLGHVDGSLSVKQRHEILEKSDVAVMTMRSITEGLDLRRYTKVYVVEAYPVPLYLSQVLGRFIRLFAKDSVEIIFCRLNGSSDDVVVNKLLTRMAERRTLLGEGKTEAGLTKLLTIDEDSDDFLAELRAACSSYEDEEEDSWDFEED